jgi:hypothetical protein
LRTVEPPAGASGSADAGAGERVAPGKVAQYQRLLRRSFPRIYLLPRAEWRILCEETWRTAQAENGRCTRAALEERLIDACNAHGIAPATKKTNSVLFQLTSAGCLTRRPDGDEDELTLTTTTLDGLLDRSRAHVIDLLGERLAKEDPTGVLDPESLTLLFDGEQSPTVSSSV